MFSSTRAIISSIKKIARTLHTHTNPITGFIKTDEPELFITNGWTSKIWALASAQAQLEEHKINCHENMIMVTTPSWLEKIASKFEDRRWGQKFGELHPIIQATLSAANPNREFCLYDFPSWGEMKNTERYCIKEMKDTFGANIINGTVKTQDIAQGPRGKIEIPITTLDNATTKLFLPEDTFFYHFFREHRKPDIPSGHHLQFIGKLFEQSSQGKAVIFGGGLSSAWAVQNFPETEFTVVIGRGSRLLETPLTKEWHEARNVTIVSLEDPLTQLKEIHSNGTVELESPKLSQGKFIGAGYAAMGSIKDPKPFPEFISRAKQAVAGQSYVSGEKFVSSQNTPPESSSHASMVYQSVAASIGKTDINIGATSKEEFIALIDQLAKKYHLDIKKEVMHDFVKGYFKDLKKLEHHDDSSKLIDLVRKNYHEFEPNQSKIQAFEDVIEELEEDYAKRVASTEDYRVRLKNVTKENTLVTKSGEVVDEKPPSSSTPSN